MIGLVLLATISAIGAIHALYLLFTGRPELNAWYGPVSAQEELEAELEELKKRGTNSASMGTAPLPTQKGG